MLAPIWGLCVRKELRGLLSASRGPYQKLGSLELESFALSDELFPGNAFGNKWAAHLW